MIKVVNVYLVVNIKEDCQTKETRFICITHMLPNFELCTLMSAKKMFLKAFMKQSKISAERIGQNRSTSLIKKYKNQGHDKSKDLKSRKKS